MRSRSLAQALQEGDGIWFETALERLRSLPLAADERLTHFLSADQAVLIARAPGRLDVMGGIADYSGSVVLELPLARSTSAILQPRSDSRIEVVSFRGARPHFVSSTLSELTEGDWAAPERLAERLHAEGQEWAAYILGIAQFCARMVTEPRPNRSAGTPSAAGGFNLVLGSDVPEGKGVSSSAALEVSSMAVVSEHFGLGLEPAAAAAACQWVENHVVGAPCGIMDQLTSLLGKSDRLLRIRCQPAVVEGFVEVPPDFRFYGIDSGVRHAVSGNEYGSVRTAAFMGYRMIAESAGLTATRAGNGVVVDDPRWGGYLANLSPGELDREFGELLPERMSGEEFLARFGGHTDAVTRVRADVSYTVKAATVHPVRENARAERFAELLENLASAPEGAEEMGRLMYESHASYGACGLGSAGTDRLVEMVRAAAPEVGLFGGRITGGGNGGTVAIFGRRDAEGAVREIAARYGEETGVRAEVFAESGPGAEELGMVRVPNQ